MKKQDPMTTEVNDSESIDVEVTCENERCINGWYLPPEIWNTRPIEDKLRKRIAELGLELGRKSVELGELVGRNIIWEVINDELKSRRENLERENDRLQEKVSVLLKRIAELESAQRWRVVADGELPEFDQDMFAVVEGEFKVGHFYQGLDFIKNKYENIYFSAGGEGLLVATHWFPIPDGLEERER